MNTSNRSPLYELYPDETSMMEFAGWEMPRDFAGIVKEHQAVRNHAGVFDVSHMGRLTVRDDTGALNPLFSRDLDGVEPGTALYGFFCEESGGCLDDAITYVRSPEEIWLVVNAANRETILEHLVDSGVDSDKLDDHTTESVLIAVQGPSAPEIMEETVDVDLPDEPYRCRWLDDGMVATTGYTGEPGGEFWFPVDRGRKVFEELIDRVTPCGLGARDTLRLEKAYPLHGHELSAKIDPVTAGLGMFVDFDHEFLGRDALRQSRDNGEQTIVGLKFKGRRRADEDATVLSGGDPVGRITSSGYSPSLEVAIGLALVDQVASEKQQLEVERGDSRLTAEVVRGPFV